MSEFGPREVHLGGAGGAVQVGLHDAEEEVLLAVRALVVDPVARGFVERDGDADGRALRVVVGRAGLTRDLERAAAVLGLVEREARVDARPGALERLGHRGDRLEARILLHGEALLASRVVELEPAPLEAIDLEVGRGPGVARERDPGLVALHGAVGVVRARGEDRVLSSNRGARTARRHVVGLELLAREQREALHVEGAERLAIDHVRSRGDARERLFGRLLRGSVGRLGRAPGERAGREHRDGEEGEGTSESEHAPP
ncbi:hypothetical protein B7O87_14365 [Cylindrospermopsis raciborskii CENA303]|uniref:Uncharacterized protein n=1 Tax=Cylindrospermopsis raciborskii CENA303 TaxID=1170769 RepID=A0A1X4G394_9CYAN|nr:hypothetical protein B7O87_14365 [Cylindrospermopsis raciborskii CENA303]